MIHGRKTLILFALGGALLAPVLRADDSANQSPPAASSPAHAGHSMREHRLQQLETKLQLTADQKPKVAAILDALDTKLRAIRSDASIERADKRTKSVDARKAADADIRALLTPDQQKIFDTLKPERPPHGKDQPHDAPPPAGNPS